MRRLAAYAGLLAGLCILPGCGYQVGGIHRGGIETVYVEPFASREFRRELEFKLTEYVQKHISRDTPYRLASRENADTILSGELLEERQSAFAPDYLSRLPREKQLTLAVRIRWKDLRSGRMLFDVPVELQAADYLPPADEPEALAQEQALDRLAAKIVARMFADW